MPKPKKASSLPIKVPHPLNLNEAAQEVASYIGQGDTLFDLIKGINKDYLLNFPHTIRLMNVIWVCFQLLVVRSSIPAGYHIVSLVHIVESVLPVFP